MGIRNRIAKTKATAIPHLVVSPKRLPGERIGKTERNGLLERMSVPECVRAVVNTDPHSIKTIRIVFKSISKVCVQASMRRFLRHIIPKDLFSIVIDSNSLLIESNSHNASSRNTHTNTVLASTCGAGTNPFTIKQRPCRLDMINTVPPSVRYGQFGRCNMAFWIRIETTNVAKLNSMSRLHP